MDTPTFPTLFLSHGSPMLALDDSPAGRFLDGLGSKWPRPRAIVLASAHYLAPGVRVGADPRPATVHDFRGFPAALHAVTYPAPGDPALARSIVATLGQAGIEASAVAPQGLDHGVWVPLRRMYPEADLPVVPLSINPHGSAADHYRLGAALAGLRAQQILVIGSGGFVHNLGDLDWHDRDAPLAPWAAQFADWMRGRLLDADHEALLDWQARAPHAARAHPTPEHLLPLFVALGAAGPSPKVTQLHQSHEMGSLALDAFAFG